MDLFTLLMVTVTDFIHALLRYIVGEPSTAEIKSCRNTEILCVTEFSVTELYFQDLTHHQWDASHQLRNTTVYREYITDVRESRCSFLYHILEQV
jgi:hypothetical protein